MRAMKYSLLILTVLFSFFTANTPAAHQLIQPLVVAVTKPIIDEFDNKLQSHLGLLMGFVF